MPPDAIDLPSLARLVAEQLAPLLRADADRLLDRHALAERLGVADRTIGGMAARSEIPPPLLHTAGVARWSWHQVLKWLESRQGKRRRTGRGRYSRLGARTNDTTHDNGHAES
jgi:hypothetical protein